MTKWMSVKVGTAVLWAAIACGGAQQRDAGPAGARINVPAQEEEQPLEVATESPSAPAAPTQPTSAELPIDDDDVVVGAPDALVTIVEFSDLQCPFCSRVQPTLAELKKRYGAQKLRFVFKHNPLPFHQQAEEAARFTQAVRLAAGSDLAHRFMGIAFERQRDLGRSAFLDWVGEIGLDRATIATLADSEDVKARVQRDMDQAKLAGATGTPAFYVNGVKISGAQPLDKFVEVADAELAKAEAQVRAGSARTSVYAAAVKANWQVPAAPSARASEPPDLTVWKVPVAGAATRGPADALVTIVAFYDYQCPFCKRVQPTMDELMQRYPSDVRLVVRHNPLPFHPRGAPAANVALEARAQRGDATFFEISRRIYDAAPDLADEKLLGIAADLGLDQGRVKRALEKSSHKKVIEADMDLANDFQARGVPHFFINGVRLSGAQALEKFVEAVEREREKALALVAQGVPRAKVYAALMKTAQSPPGPDTKLVPLPRDVISRGPAGAPIVIQMFSDFQCPFCKRVQETLKELDRAHPGQIRWVFRHLPLPFHKAAVPAARAAMEARRQRGNKGFWAMHDALFEAQGGSDGLSDDVLVALAAKQNLDLERFRAALQDTTHDAAIDADKTAANTAGISGTPGFTVNGYYLSGAQPLAAFEKLIRYSRKNPARAKPAPAATP